MITLQDLKSKSEEVAHERRERLATLIENLRPQDDLDMGAWVVESECGTTACIAGWAFIQMTQELGSEPDGGYYHLAKDYLGLTSNEAEDLFFGAAFDAVSPEQAAQALRRLNAGEDSCKIWRDPDDKEA